MINKRKKEIPSPSNNWTKDFRMKEKIERASRVELASSLREEEQWREDNEDKPVKRWRTNKHHY